MEEGEMTRCELLVIGGSAGSLEVVLALLPQLPEPLPLAIVIVLHRKGGGETSLENLFHYKTKLPVREVEDKDPIVPGTIYIAPVDYHLLVEDDRTFALDISEKVHYSRPSIGVTFESAAAVYRERAACILLSGANEDGATGLVAAKQYGALVAVQEPSTAVVPFMPESALALLPEVKRVKAGEVGEFVKEL